MNHKIVKKIYRAVGFDIKPDPSEWTQSDLEHMARVLIRKTKKSPIISVDYIGIWNTNTPIEDIPTNWVKNNAHGSYMRFEVTLGVKVPKTSRRQCLGDIITQLIIEVL